MANKIVENKIVQLSIDDAQLTRGLQNAMKGMSSFDKQLNGIDTSSFDKIDKSAQTLGGTIGGFISKIPIIGKIADSVLGIGKSAQTSSDQLSNMAGQNIGGIGNQANQASESVSGIGRAAQAAAGGFNILAGAASVALGGTIMQLSNQAMSAINKFTMQPMTQGFREYEEELESTRILTSALGKESSGAIKESMLDLENYAQTTRYNVQTMNSSLAQFVNAGVGLKESTVAIKGWGNLAASAGASTEGFASSLQFGVQQALQMGKMTTQNWMSIENANMATQKFKQTLIDTGKKMGKDVPNDINSFRESLQDGWLTNDIFIKSLEEMANNATFKEMAENVYTYGEAMDVIGEGVQNTWSKVWRSIIGEGDALKDVWGPVAEHLGAALDKPGQAVLGLANKFNELGGRTALFGAIATAWGSIEKIGKAVADAWGRVFPNSQVNVAQKLIDIFKKLSETLKISDNTISGIGTVFEVFFTIVREGLQILGSLGKAIADIIPDGLIGKFFDWINKMTGAGETLVTVTNGVVELKKTTANLSSLDNISKIFDNMMNSIKGLFNIGSFKMDLSWLNGLKDVGNTIGEWFDNIRESEPLLNMFNNTTSSVFGNIIQILGQFGRALASVFGAGLSVLVQNAVDLITGLVQAANQLSFGTVIKGGLIAHILNTTNDLKKAGGIIEAIKGTFESFGEAIGGLKDVSGIFGNLKDVLADYSKSIKANIIKNIAIAVGILAAAILVLSLIPANALKQAITGLASVATILVLMQAAISKIGDGKQSLVGVMKSVIQMTAIAGAILVMTVAMKVIATMSWDDIIKGLVSVGVLAGIMIGIQAASSKLSNGKGGMGLLSMIGMALTIKILANTLNDVSNMSWGDIFKGIVTITAIVGELILLSKLMGRVSLASSAGIFITVLAIKMLIPPLQALGEMSIGSIVKSLITLAAGLAVIVTAMNLATSGIAGAVALSIISSALIPFALSLKVLGGMDWGSIAKGLVALAGGLAVLVIAGAGATYVAGGLLALSVAVLAIGAGIGLAAAGIFLFGTALNLLAGMSTSTIATMVGNFGTFVTELGNIGPKLGAAAANLATGFATSFIKGVVDNIQGVLTSLAALINIICDFILQNAPKLISTVFSLLMMVVDALLIKLPELVVKIGEGILIAIETLTNFIDENKDRISTAFTNLIQALFDLFVAVWGGIFGGIGQVFGPIIDTILSGLSDLFTSIGESWNEFWAGVANWGSDLMNTIGNGISIANATVVQKAKDVWDGIKSIWDGAKNIAQGIGSAIGQFFGNGINSAKNTIVAVGQDIWNGIKAVWDGAKNAVTGIGSAIGQGFSNGLSTAKNGAVAAGQSIWNGVKNTLSSVSGMFESGSALVRKWGEGLVSAFSTVKSWVKGGIDAIRGFFPNSPAKEGPLSGSGWTKLGQSGVAFAEQWGSGIKSGLGSVIDMTSRSIDEIQNVVNSITDYDYNNLNITPVITPVVDTASLQTNLKNTATTSLSVAYDNLSLEAARLNSQSNNIDKVIKGMSSIYDTISELVDINETQIGVMEQSKIVQTNLNGRLVSDELAPEMDRAQSLYNNRQGRLNGRRPELDI